YFSTNGGDTWAISSAPSKQWDSLAMSADGKTVLALTSSASTPLYVSTDSGTSWTTNSTPANGMSGVAASADGNQWSVAGPGGAVFVSTNAGASWISNNIHAQFFDVPCIASSPDGSTLITGGRGNGTVIYTSTNLGISWTTNNARGVWG